MGSVIGLFSFIDNGVFLMVVGKYWLLGFIHAFGQGLVRGGVLEFEDIVNGIEM